MFYENILSLKKRIQANTYNRILVSIEPFKQLKIYMNIFNIGQFLRIILATDYNKATAKI
jgi:hypothetical protein